jgi:acetyl esterase/lipase
VLVPAYRLAPEHTFPAALQDGLTSYRWLLRQGTPACRIALVGDSAGGGLCLAVAVSLRMAGEPLPGALLLLSPWTDLTFSGESNRSRKAMDPIFGRNSLGAGFAPAYLGMDSPTNPLISPLFADLTGLPPTLIQVGTHEVLYDDATRLSASLKSCGVHADLQVWEGMWHVFQIFTPWVPESHQAVLSLGSFIRENIQ